MSPVRALLAARWGAIRPAWARWALALPLALVLAAPVLSVALGGAIPPGYEPQVGLLLPAAITGLLVTSVLSPLLLGGGFELVPEAQLAAYPLGARTRVDVSLLLTPLNLAWVLQTCGLAMVTAYVADGPLAPWVPGLLAVLLAAALGVLGLLLSWLLLGWARTPRRRAAAAAVTAVAVALAVWRLRELALVDVAAALGADRVASLLQATSGSPAIATVAAATLLAVLVLAHELAVAAAARAVRLPVVRLARDSDRPVPRRAPARTLDAELRRAERVGIWRSVPLRRGVLVIALTPAVLTLLAPLDWSLVTLLPPLVATGATLLLPVNAFALDGAGAVLLSSLPGWADRALAAKATAAAELVALPVALSVGAALVRVTGPWTPLHLACVLGAAVGCVALAVSHGLRWSVVHPYRADLRGPRDTPAPPGALAWYSARLAVVTGLTGTAYGVCLQAGNAVAALVVTLLVAAAVAWSAYGTARRWRDPGVRARVVARVASG